MIKYCPYCGKKIIHDVYYCENCGTELKQFDVKNSVGKNENDDELEICQECGAKINPQLNYCQNCGVNHPPHILSKINKEKKKKGETSKNTLTESKIYENIINKTITYENTNKLKKCPKCGRDTNAYLVYCEHCMSEQSSYFITNDPSIKRRNEAFNQRKIQKNDNKPKTKSKNDNKPIKTKSKKNDKISIREFIKLYLNAPIKQKTIITLEFLLLLFFIVAVPPLGLSFLAIIFVCYLLNKLDIIKL